MAKSGNKQLGSAKAAKNDEFYTQYADIEKEVNAYLEFDPDTFCGKTVLLPCDDPEWSKFTRFFAENFERLGLRKLVSTSYAPNAKKAKYGVDLFDFAAGRKLDPARGRILVLDHDANGSGRIDLDDLEWKYLEGDGDFRSDEVRRLRDAADVIVTNPPFSLFREFLAWIMEADKKFLVIGNMNTINTKDVFPLVVSGKLWMGNGFTNGNAYFQVADGTKISYADGVYDSVTNLVKFRNCCWYTNLEHGRRHQPLQLMSMSDNLRYSRHREIRDVGYRHYDNYDAIEVPYSDAIPSDYDGVMGVPVTFLDKFCPEQFEIVGITKTWFGAATKVYPEQVQIDVNGVRKTVTKLNDGAVLKIDEPPKDSTWYEVGGERFIQTYPRILIRRKKST